MRTSNPALRPDIFSRTAKDLWGRSRSELMTVDGVIQKTSILAALLIFSAGFVWSLAFKTVGYEGLPAMASNPGMLKPWILGGGLGGFLLAIVTSFKVEWSPFTAPAYAIVEGLALGGLSAFMELRFPGIVVQAALLTMGTLVTMLLAYRAGVIQVTEKFRSVVIMATGGIAVAYLMSMILGWFGADMSFMRDSSPLSIGISLVVIVVAALNLILDFSTIEQGASRGAARYMEWYAAFGLVVTLVWLYVEFLRLLSKLNSKD